METLINVLAPLPIPLPGVGRVIKYTFVAGAASGAVGVMAITGLSRVLVRAVRSAWESARPEKSDKK